MQHARMDGCAFLSTLSIEACERTKKASNLFSFFKGSSMKRSRSVSDEALLLSKLLPTNWRTWNVPQFTSGSRVME